MNHKIVFAATALLLMSSAAYSQTTTQCPPGTLSCNIATVGDEQIDATQTIGDTVNPTYAPDSSSSSSAATNTNDIVSQGGAADATANGNTSTNNNQSSADNRATNNMTNGNISNDVTGGNITGGNLTQTGSADITNSGGNVTGGTATTNSGNVSGGAGGSVGDVRSTSSASTGASTSSATGGDSSSRSSVAGSGNSRNANTNRTGNQTTNVDASQRTTVKHAANTAAPIMMPGYGPQNCYGDTNPSGSFGASIQTFGWGVTANRSKASNVCALTQIGAGLETGATGGALAAGYIAQQDPMAYEALSTTINPTTGDYYILTPQERARRQAAADAEALAKAARNAPTLICPTNYSLNPATQKCRQNSAPSQAPAASDARPSVIIVGGKRITCPASHWASISNGKPACNRR